MFEFSPPKCCDFGFHVKTPAEVLSVKYFRDLRFRLSRFLCSSKQADEVCHKQFPSQFLSQNNPLGNFIDQLKI